MEFPHWLPVVHGVEGGDFVDAHRRNLEDARYFVHDADGGVPVLSLTKVEEGHHGCSFVLWWIAFEDLRDECFILGGEFEGNGRVVFGGVAMLRGELEGRVGYLEGERTTARASLELEEVEEKGRS